MADATTPKARNFRPEIAELMALDTGDATMLVADALRADFGTSDHAVKRIARAANSNVRSAKNWLAGDNMPLGVHFLKLMAHSPTLRAEVRRLTAMEIEAHPDFQRYFNDAVRIFMSLPEPEQRRIRAQIQAENT